jgi:hypothetical protein
LWREFTEFADELKKARQFGSMTSFGRGLPRGGELSAIKSLERQEEILRALHRCGPTVSCQLILGVPQYGISIISQLLCTDGCGCLV